MGTGVPKSRLSPGGEYSHQIQVSLRCRPQSPCPGVAHVKTGVNMSSWFTVSEQCNNILILSRWVPETQGPGEAQVGPES